ncbi:DUF4279 domain-containing protein [Streptomyces sp. NPDC087420]|uniref:DUF4279 domain-containing protein n=1 Tax=Streptomyces sp. NPDC087420 TaxID=3365785 RepID=UPI00383772D1
MSVGPFRMYVRVVSTTLLPGDIDERLGVRADEAWAIGGRRRPGSRPREHTDWTRRAEAPEPGARPEDLERIVLGWGLPFARALGALARSGDARISLVIVQQIEDLDDEMAKGIVLGAELVAWLAVAQASVDIDQFFLHECGEAGKVTAGR